MLPQHSVALYGDAVKINHGYLLFSGRVWNLNTNIQVDMLVKNL